MDAFTNSFGDNIGATLKKCIIWCYHTVLKKSKVIIKKPNKQPIS